MCKVADKKTTTETTTTKIPTLARYWQSAYNAVPKSAYLPGTSLDFSFAVVSAVFLMVVRFGSEWVLETFFNWPKDTLETKQAASCLAAICHSSLLCPGLLTALLSRPYNPSEKLSAAPKWWQEHVTALLQFCTGYMIYDAAINIIWLKFDRDLMYPVFDFDDCLFLVHHVITSLYMTSTRILGAGHVSAMICMLLGELSNPLHNSYIMAEIAMKLDCCNGPVGQSMQAFIEVAFAACYNFLRVIVGPPFMLHLTFNLLTSKEGRDIPILARSIWIFMVWAVIFGSFSWIEKCHGILVKFVESKNNYIIMGNNGGEL